METFYNTVDECIMAAYKHVKETGSIIENYNNWTSFGVQDEVGLKSSDGHFFLMSLNDNYLDANKHLFKLIRSNNISTVDFINKQLLAFL